MTVMYPFSVQHFSSPRMVKFQNAIGCRSLMDGCINFILVFEMSADLLEAMVSENPPGRATRRP